MSASRFKEMSSLLNLLLFTENSINKNADTLRDFGEKVEPILTVSIWNPFSFASPAKHRVQHVFDCGWGVPYGDGADREWAEWSEQQRRQACFAEHDPLYQDQPWSDTPLEDPQLYALFLECVQQVLQEDGLTLDLAGGIS